MTAAETKEWKDKLLANTQEALDQGAFGAPWFWVRNAEGKEEPFFGSDRYVTTMFSPPAVCEEERYDMTMTMTDAGHLGSISCGSSWACRGRISNCYLKDRRKRERICEEWEGCVSTWDHFRVHQVCRDQDIVQ